MEKDLHRIAEAQAGKFHFSDREWKNILEALGVAKIEPPLRSRLELTVGTFLRGRADWVRPSKEEKQALQGVAKSTEALRKNLDRLSRFGLPLKIYSMSHSLDADFGAINRRWVEFRKELQHLGQSAESLSNPPRLGPDGVDLSRVDLSRNEAWQVAAEIYEKAVGRRPAATEYVNVGAGRKPAGGQFIRFMLAFMAAIPGARPKTTGDQIREWQRKYWKPAADLASNGEQSLGQ